MCPDDGRKGVLLRGGIGEVSGNGTEKSATDDRSRSRRREHDEAPRYPLVPEFGSANVVAVY